MLTGLPPIIGRDARVLVLGSMPSVASLTARQYYAHPQNTFWQIMTTLAARQNALDACPPQARIPYPKRIAAVKRAGVAVWDVLGECEREGSGDAAIVSGSERANDVVSLLVKSPSVCAVALNGGKARQCFDRHIRANLPREMQVVALPSTSPANARMTPARKQTIWLDKLLPLLQIKN